MTSGFLESLNDAETLQESLRAFESDGILLEEECPKTVLVFREIDNPDEAEIPPEEPEDDPYDQELDIFYTKTVIIIRDYETDLPIPNAILYFNGAVRYADANGKIFLGRLKGGSTAHIKVNASGYIPTWEDTLDNDVLLLPNVPRTPRAGEAIPL